MVENKDEKNNDHNYGICILYIGVWYKDFET